MDGKFDLRKAQEALAEKTYILTEEAKSKAKFGKLVFEFPQERNEVVAEGDPEDYVVKPQAYFRGAMQIPGAEFNQSYQIFVKPFFLDRIQHRHKTDEFLVFLGASFPTSSISTPGSNSPWARATKPRPTSSPSPPSSASPPASITAP